MDIRIECLPEPDLEFGNSAIGPEPKRALRNAGPFDRQETPEIIRLGLVGPVQEVALAKAWLPRLNGMLVSREGNGRRFRDFPGAPKALSARFDLEDRFVRPLDDARLQFALATKQPGQRFD